MSKLLLCLILSLCCSIANAQEYYTLQMCRTAYHLRMYETIMPSLLHIKSEAENATVFDANKYLGAVELLCAIYTNYQKDTENSAKTMEEALKTLNLKTGNSYHTRLAVIKLVEIYCTLHQYDRAETNIKTAEKLFDAAIDFGEDYLNFLMEKISFYKATQNNQKLTAECQNVIKNYKNYNGDIMLKNDYVSLKLLCKIAESYLYLGDEPKAEFYSMHIVENIKNYNASLNSLFNSAINMLAIIKMRHHQWQEALDLYDRIKMFNDNNDIVYYKNILTCALSIKNFDKIKKYYNLFSKEMLENKARIFFKSTEENHYAEWLETVKDVEYYNYAAYQSMYAPAIADGFASTVFFKALSVESNIILSDYVKKSGLTNLKTAYDKCRKLKHNFIFSNDNLENKTRDYLEYERLFDSILTQTQRLTQIMRNKTKTFGEIQRSLSENEYVVDFCLIPDYEQYPEQGDFLGAYIVGKNYSVPKLIKLVEVSTLEKLLTSSSDEQIFYSELYSPEKSRQIYDLIFKPLESNLRNANKIYYSPYGVLANLNFDYLADDHGQFICNKTNLVRISSSAQIMQVKSRNTTVAKSAAIFGNIDYKTPQNTPANALERDIDFLNLPYTKNEIDSIVKVLNVHNIAAKTYEQTSATEESFKLLSSNSPEILHLATHGFCLDTKEKAANKPFAQSVNTYSQKESAMALCGLALSGANNAWKGNFNTSDIEDGILTAYEISQLDLSNTKLVVLSACETARGKIFPVDGVFGLQRAFKQAGAGAILMSLWKVDDNATALFMQHFYKFLFETSDRHKALKMAQDEVRKQHPDPYYWAAWVMLD